MVPRQETSVGSSGWVLGRKQHPPFGPPSPTENLTPSTLPPTPQPPNIQVAQGPHSARILTLITGGPATNMEEGLGGPSLTSLLIRAFLLPCLPPSGGDGKAQGPSSGGSPAERPEEERCSQPQPWFPGTLPSQATPRRDPQCDKCLTPTFSLRGRGPLALTEESPRALPGTQPP